MLTAALLALATAVAGPAVAGSSTIDQVRGLLAAGKPAEAADLVEQAPVRDALAADTAGLDGVCQELASDCDLLLESSVKATERLAKALAAIAEGCLAADGADLTALRARSYVLMAKARALDAKKEAAKPEDLIRAADGFEKIHATDPAGGYHLLLASEALAMAAALPGADAPAIWLRVDGLAASLRRSDSLSPRYLAGAVHVLLERVRWGSSRKEPDLAARLEAAVAFMADALKEDPDDADLCTAHNEICGMVRSLGLAHPRLTPRTRTVTFESGLQVDVPLGRLWVDSQSTAGSPTPGYPSGGAQEKAKPVQQNSILQYGRWFHGALLLNVRTLTVFDFRWDLTWKLPDGSYVKGDSIKDIANKHFDAATEENGAVKTTLPLSRAALKQCDPGWAFDLRRPSPGGKWLRRRDWYFKSKQGHLTTYQVSIRDFRQGDPEDPALLGILESIREKRK